MRNPTRYVFVAISSFISAGFVVNACGGDDTTLSDDDAGASLDAATFDASSSDGNIFDAGARADVGAPRDAGLDAGPPPHLAFITAEKFSGNLVGEANARIADGGVAASDGGTFSEYHSAADALCEDSAHVAHIDGKFSALVSETGNVGVPDLELSDADGPWALVDGTPVVASTADLSAGRLRSVISKTAEGAAAPASYAWTGFRSDVSCQGFASASPSDHSIIGNAERIGSAMFYYGNSACDGSYPLYCFQVGPGAGHLVFPSLPAGAKTAFVTDQTLTATFALPDAGVLDGGVGAGDAPHAIADAICNQAARGAGSAKTFHAYLSSSTTSADAYFSSLSMNGPWYRADGLEIASSLASLSANGPQTEIAFFANGAFPPTFAEEETLIGATDENCGDFTTTTGVVVVGFNAVRGTSALNFVGEGCASTPFALFCFEQ